MVLAICPNGSVINANSEMLGVKGVRKLTANEMKQYGYKASAGEEIPEFASDRIEIPVNFEDMLIGELHSFYVKTQLGRSFDTRQPAEDIRKMIKKEVRAYNKKIVDGYFESLPTTLPEDFNTLSKAKLVELAEELEVQIDKDNVKSEIQGDIIEEVSKREAISGE